MPTRQFSDIRSHLRPGRGDGYQFLRVTGMRKTKKGKEDELAPQRTQDSQEEDPHCRRLRRDLPLPLVRQKVPHAPRLALLRPVQSKRGGGRGWWTSSHAARRSSGTSFSRKAHQSARTRSCGLRLLALRRTAWLAPLRDGPESNRRGNCLGFSCLRTSKWTRNKAARFQNCGTPPSCAN